MKKLLIVLALLGVAPAYAQEKATAIRCNASVVMDTAVIGVTQLVAPPKNNGAIYICGYTVAATASINAGLTFSTGVGGLTVQVSPSLSAAALNTKLTPLWTFPTPTGVYFDNSSAFRGLYVPPGNGVNMTTSGTTNTVQAILYYYQQNN